MTNRTSVRDHSKLWSLFLLRRVLSYAFQFLNVVAKNGKAGLGYGALAGLASGGALALLLGCLGFEPIWAALPVLIVALVGEGLGIWRGIHQARGMVAVQPALEGGDA